MRALYACFRLARQRQRGGTRRYLSTVGFQEATVNTPIKFLRKNVWQAVVLALLLNCTLFVATPSLRAEDEHEHCRHRIEKAQARLDHAIERHGEHSRQAEEKRRDLHEERERCWNRYHGWWDGQRWHTERDWDIVISH